MNTGRPKGNQKHLDLSARIIIEQHLNNGDSFTRIQVPYPKKSDVIPLSGKEAQMHLPLFPVQTIMIVQSRGQIYAMSCICEVIMNVGANVSSAENSDAAMSVNFINQENVKN